MIHDKSLRTYIKHPETIDETAIVELRDLCTRYPYFHAARILHLRALYQTHSPQFDKELKQSALLLPDRRAIFHLIEESNYAPREDRLQSRAAQHRGEAPIDTTSSLIDNFLSSQPQEPTPPHRAKADSTTDYMAYMLEHEAELQTEQEPQAHAPATDGTGDIIDTFLSQPQDERLKLKDIPEEQLQKPQLPSSAPANAEIFTEALARIYIKQGKYERAVEIIKRLSAKYPKKNRYFADQIRFLEKLIINNKYKK